MQDTHLLLVPPPHAFTASTVALLRAADRCGIRATVLSPLPSCVFAPHACVEAVLPLPHHPAALLSAAALDAVDARHAHAPFRRVVSFSEEHVELAAMLNARYQLGGNPPRAARLSRDKHRMRTAMREAGVPVPAFHPVSSREEFAAAVDRVGYPCISKPVKACASEGVVKLEPGADLDAAWAFTAAVAGSGGGAPQALVEEYVSGPEVSVEIIVAGGVARVAGVTEKTTEPEPYFGEVMHVFPALLDTATEARLEEVARGAVRALELEEGGAHLEVRLSPRGPVVIECAARLAGDSIPIVIAMATGVDLYECVLRQAAGADFSLARRKRRCGGIRFVQTEAEGRLQTLEFDRERLGRIRGIVGWGGMREAGARVGRPPRGETHRLAFLIAVASDPDAVRSALREAEASCTYTLSAVAA